MKIRLGSKEAGFFFLAPLLSALGAGGAAGAAGAAGAGAGAAGAAGAGAAGAGAAGAGGLAGLLGGAGGAMQGGSTLTNLVNTAGAVQDFQRRFPPMQQPHQEMMLRNLMLQGVQQPIMGGPMG